MGPTFLEKAVCIGFVSARNISWILWFLLRELPWFFLSSSAYFTFLEVYYDSSAHCMSRFLWSTLKNHMYFVGEITEGTSEVSSLSYWFSHWHWFWSWRSLCIWTDFLLGHVVENFVALIRELKRTSNFSSISWTLWIHWEFPYETLLLNKHQAMWNRSTFSELPLLFSSSQIFVGLPSSVSFSFLKMFYSQPYRLGYLPWGLDQVGMMICYLSARFLYFGES